MYPLPFADLVHSSPDLIAFFSLDSRVLYMNEAGRAMVGLPDDVDVTTTKVSDYLIEGRQANSELMRDRLLSEGKITATNVLRHWQGGAPIPVEQSLYVVRDPDGNPVSLASVQRDLRPSSRAQEALNRMSDILLVVGSDSQLLYGSPSAARLLQVPEQDLAGLDLRQFLHPDDLPRAFVELTAALHDEDARNRRTTVRLVRPGRRELIGTFEIQVDDLRREPQIGGIVVLARDVSEQQQAIDAERGQAELLELIATGASLTEVVAGVTDWLSGSLVGMVNGSLMLRHEDAPVPAEEPEDVPLLVTAAHGKGFNPQAFVGSWITDARAPSVRAVSDGAPAFVHDLRDSEQTPLVASLTALGVRGVWASPVRAPVGQEILGSYAVYRTCPGLPGPHARALLERAVRMIGIAVERHQLLTTLRHAAEHDELTGLPNRVLLLRELEQALAEDEHPPVVIFLDLDRLKVVNDSLGHSFGDQLLTITARRLQAAAGQRHLVARFGGDEFAVLARGLEGEQVEKLTQTIVAALTPPVRIAGRELRPAGSAGVVVASRKQSAADVLRDADIAMYAAKAAGGDRAVRFGHRMRLQAVARLDLEGQIRQALLTDEFRVHLQPVVTLQGQQPVGFEALVRWQHPTRGLLGPGQFIDVAEETGLVIPLGERVLELVAEAVQQCGPCEHQPWIAVNVSAAQLSSTTLVPAVAGAIRAMRPTMLALELTESTLHVESALSRTVLADLDALGVGLSLDDFGTGYSSLSALTRLPFRTLKIDRSFVAQLASSHEAVAVAEAVLRLGEALDMRVVAEGIETREQHETLLAMGCRYGQGYLYGRPVPAAQALAMLASADAPVIARPRASLELAPDRSVTA